MSEAERSPAAVFAIRHAPTLADGLCVGDAEVACAVTADEAAARMCKLAAGHRFQAIWSSPRSRCLEPARVMAERLALPLFVDERLREICLGAWQGRAWSAIEADDGGRLRAWMSDWTQAAPPEGETTADLSMRVRAWWDELPSGCHLLVAHAGVIRALRVLVRAETWPHAMREPAACLQGQWFPSTPLGERA